jgi:hypothetical protein
MKHTHKHESDKSLVVQALLPVQGVARANAEASTNKGSDTTSRFDQELYEYELTRIRYEVSEMSLSDEEQDLILDELDETDVNQSPRKHRKK